MAPATEARRVLDHLQSLGDPAGAAQSQRYFKTGPGEYGEGDVFLGIRMPVLRACVTQFKELPEDAAEELLRSPLHEVRLFTLLVWVRQFERGEASLRERLYHRYLANTAYINNWDLVDSSAAQIVGAWLHDREKAPLTVLAHSPVLWERRIAVIATLYDIRRQRYDETLRIAAILLDDEHDLIHKAVGWMLREVGKRERAVEVGFLAQHYRQMPRTMLRYAIEKFSPEERQAYLKGSV